jgi:hypothetical protein
LSPKQIEEVQNILSRLEDVQKQSRGSSKDQSTSIFKNLLRQKGFADRVKKLVHALKKFDPKDKPIQGNIPGMERKTVPIKSGKKIPISTSNSMNITKPSGIELESDSSTPKSIAVEELFSEILQILERRLGPDHDELESIASEVEAVIYKWCGTSAT